VIDAMLATLPQATVLYLAALVLGTLADVLMSRKARKR
jgi:hypothetical protein